MYFEIEYFRILHYFYFYLGSIGIISAVFAWGEFQLKSLILIAMAFVNLYLSYKSELKVREVLMESRAYSILSHILILGLAIVFYILLASFSEILLLITTYVGIFSLLILLLIRLKMFDKFLLFAGFSKQNIGVKKIILLEKEGRDSFKELFSIADINLLKSYAVGTSEKIDESLCIIADTSTADTLLFNLKFTFIYIYEKKLEETKDRSKQEGLRKTISELNGLL